MPFTCLPAGQMIKIFLGKKNSRFMKLLRGYNNENECSNEVNYKRERLKVKSTHNNKVCLLLIIGSKEKIKLVNSSYFVLFLRSYCTIIITFLLASELK